MRYDEYTDFMEIAKRIYKMPHSTYEEQERRKSRALDLYDQLKINYMGDNDVNVIYKEWLVYCL